jgi:hypothetical protein
VEGLVGILGFPLLWMYFGTVTGRGSDAAWFSAELALAAVSALLYMRFWSHIHLAVCWIALIAHFAFWSLLSSNNNSIFDWRPVAALAISSSLLWSYDVRTYGDSPNPNPLQSQRISPAAS